MDNDPRFWWVDLDGDNFSGIEEWYAQDVLVGIVDEQAGGIVAYCHRSRAAEIIAALSKDA